MRSQYLARFASLFPEAYPEIGFVPDAYLVGTSHRRTRIDESSAPVVNTAITSNVFLDEPNRIGVFGFPKRSLLESL
jgi:hypothetical protein